MRHAQAALPRGPALEKIGFLAVPGLMYVYQHKGAKSRIPTWLCGWASPVHCAASGSVEELELELERRSSRSRKSRHEMGSDNGG